MAQEVEVRYYFKKDAFADPVGDAYVEMIEKTDESSKVYTFVILGQFGDDVDRKILDEPTAFACELAEVLQQEWETIAKEDFDKVEAKWTAQEAEINKAWRESDTYHKFLGIHIVTEEHKDIMNAVSKSLRKPRETS